MADDVSRLKARIQELEKELSSKSAEVQVYKNQLAAANKQLEKVITQVGQELKMANQLQKHLSPTEIPPISGFEFSSKFISGNRSGGDYFDIFELEDKLKFAILVSSASGYSLSALFLSVLIKVSMAAEARKGSAPEKTVDALVKELQPQMGPDDKISLFYGIVDKRSYDFSYCNVGHHEAYMQIVGQESLEHLEACAGPISKNSKNQFSSMKVPLNPRDRIVICTEGVTKAQNSQQQMWGGEGLREAIRSAPRAGVHELRNEILFKLERFTGNAESDRDQTIVVTEVKDRVIKLAKG